MPEGQAIADAAASILEAVTAGTSLRDGLAELARAAGAEGAVLVRQATRELPFIVETPSIAEAVALYRVGKSPPDPRYDRVKQTLADGFAGDFSFLSSEQIARDAFYQEFLARYHIRWHASALLEGDPVAGLYLSLKRRTEIGPFTPAEIAQLDRGLPMLRAAMLFGRGVIDAAADRVAIPFEARREGLLRLDWKGEIIGFNAVAEAMIGERISVSRNRLVPPRSADRQALEAAIARALAGQPALLPMTLSLEGPAVLVLVLPVLGLANELYSRTAALAVILDPKREETADQLSKPLLREAFALTRMEAEIATRIGSGLSIQRTAVLLGIAPDTARMHLKSVFQKTETNRQAELAALLARLQF